MEEKKEKDGLRYLFPFENLDFWNRLLKLGEKILYLREQVSPYKHFRLFAGCFSFYPGKNLGAYGEVGAFVTQKSDITGKMRMVRDHGQSKKYPHEVIG